MLRQPPTPTLFPYTTLFRSLDSLLEVMNTTLGPSDLLGGSFSVVSGSGFGLSGFDPFTGIAAAGTLDRKSTRLNSSHVSISYAVFCLKKKLITNFICSFMAV